MKKPTPAVVRGHIDGIEAEMKQVNLWHAQPPPPEAFNFGSAFAMDTMSFDQWLQFIFIPRVRQIIASGGQFPSSSSVGTQAVREFDTVPTASRLVSLLCEFDALFR